MKLTIELQAYLMQYSPDGKDTFDYEMPVGAKIWDVIKKLGVPDELASIIIVSNASVDYQHTLKDGDHITMIPPLAGG